MKRMKSIAAAALAVLLIGTLTTSAVAEPVSAGKEEVIYIMTDASGKVTDVEAVNIFAGGSITDYGDYSAVKPLNTTDTIRQNGEEITFTSDADRVYYQGTLKSTTIPWNISLRYFLDGKEYAPAELAGKSGALEIRFSVTENPDCPGSFYENYALQAAFTLDTNRCRNIVADGATVANVGSNKQLSYTILPGRGLETVIRADVTDFEMEAVAINGVRLHLNIELDDAEIMDQVEELISAISRLDSGASSLSSGAGALSGATDTLSEKVGELYTGVGSLTSGAEGLSSGLADITKKNDRLTDGAYAGYEGLCSASAAALNAQLKEYGMDPVTLTPSTYEKVLQGLLKKLDADAAYQQAYQKALQQVTQQVEGEAEKLYEGYIQSQADRIYEEYVASQADSLYTQVATQAVYEQLIEQGYTGEQANAYLQSAQGQAMVKQTVANMTSEQKEQIRAAAVSRLTAEQKTQILQGALRALTEEQKTQIRQEYIQQMMASDEVTKQLTAAVSAVNAAAGQVSDLKGKLDSYGVFYQGLLDYTDAVSNAAAGAENLGLNMEKLYAQIGTLSLSVGNLNEAAQKLDAGARELASGTATLAGKTSGMDGRIEDEIRDITSGLTGDGEETVSFVSQRNTNVDSVQFVIKTAAIEKAASSTDTPVEEVSLTFWQKLLRLFGLY